MITPEEIKTAQSFKNWDLSIEFDHKKDTVDFYGRYRSRRMKKIGNDWYTLEWKGYEKANSFIEGLRSVISRL